MHWKLWILDALFPFNANNMLSFTNKPIAKKYDWTSSKRRKKKTWKEFRTCGKSYLFLCFWRVSFLLGRWWGFEKLLLLRVECQSPSTCRKIKSFPQLLTSRIFSGGSELYVNHHGRGKTDSQGEKSRKGDLKKKACCEYRQVMAGVFHKNSKFSTFLDIRGRITIRISIKLPATNIDGLSNTLRPLPVKKVLSLWKTPSNQISKKYQHGCWIAIGIMSSWWQILTVADYRFCFPCTITDEESHHGIQCRHFLPADNFQLSSSSDSSQSIHATVPQTNPWKAYR